MNIKFPKYCNDRYISNNEIRRHFPCRILQFLRHYWDHDNRKQNLKLLQKPNLFNPPQDMWRRLFFNGVFCCYKSIKWFRSVQSRPTSIDAYEGKVKGVWKRYKQSRMCIYRGFEMYNKEFDFLFKFIGINRR